MAREIVSDLIEYAIYHKLIKELEEFSAKFYFLIIKTSGATSKYSLFKVRYLRFMDKLPFCSMQFEIASKLLEKQNFFLLSILSYSIHKKLM